MAAYCQMCATEYRVDSGGVVGRTATCDTCRADLHACVQCAHYDPKAYNECHEPQAERVDDRRSSNFCDYFRVVSTKPAQPGAARLSARDQAGRSKLESLFKKPSDD
jgi:hypothetical protein